MTSDESSSKDLDSSSFDDMILCVLCKSCAALIEEKKRLPYGIFIEYKKNVIITVEITL